MSNYKVNSQWLGLISYKKALLAQEEAHHRIKILNSKDMTVFGLEHEPVVTLGLRAHDKKQICNFENLKKLNYEIVKTRRGGLATLHNSGQLVIYPIVNLRGHKLALRDYVELLLKVTTSSLKSIGVDCMYEKSDNPGVYTKQGKLAFLGLQIKSGVSLHGLAINLNNNLSDFESINSCGVSKLKLDSAEQVLGEKTELKSFFNIWCSHFEKELD